MMSKPIEVLLVEDSASDAALMLDALAAHPVKNNVYTVSDGEEAMDFLLQQGNWTTAPTPSLIFLDLNLPRKDGREVLEEIKAHATLRVIPVVVMTTSTASADVRMVYMRYASSYIVKPQEVEPFLNVMKILCDYWFQIVRLPC